MSAFEFSFFFFQLTILVSVAHLVISYIGAIIGRPIPLRTMLMMLSVVSLLCIANFFYS